MGASLKFKESGKPREFDVELSQRDGGELRVRVDKENFNATVEPISDDAVIVQIEGRAIRVLTARTRDSILVTAGPAQFEFVSVEDVRGRRAHGLATPEITAPMPGKVVKVLVSEGQHLQTGDAMIVLEAMKMETALNAEAPATVKKIRVAPGDMVDHGAVLLELSSPEASSAAAGATPDR